MEHIIKTIAAKIFQSQYRGDRPSLCRQATAEFLDELLPTLVPELGNSYCAEVGELERALVDLYRKCIKILGCVEPKGTSLEKLEAKVRAWFATFVEVDKKLQLDAEFIAKNDPAATAVTEVFLSYPGFFAIMVYRLAHELYLLNVPYLPRLFCEIAHSRTGIDIHPGAEIGVPFFIDHGTGVVIGKTARIGDRVMMYQGVTLGAMVVKKSEAGLKRHPTVEDDCVIYSNAIVLGGDTVVGKGSTIGGSVWLTTSVPQGSRVFHKPQIDVVSG